MNESLFAPGADVMLAVGVVIFSFAMLASSKASRDAKQGMQDASTEAGRSLHFVGGALALIVVLVVSLFVLGFVAQLIKGI